MLHIQMDADMVSTPSNNHLDATAQSDAPNDSLSEDDILFAVD